MDKEKLEDGFIKLELLKIHTANHFTMRVTACRKSAYFKWKQFDTWHSLNENLRKYYALPLSHRIHTSPKIGDLCVILLDKPYRCCVENTSNCYITVSLIDYGEINKCKATDLFVLKNEFYDVPAQVVDVYIAGIRPADNQTNWLKIATSNVEHWFKSVPFNGNPECYIEANVILQLSDILLVDDIQLVEKSPTAFNKVISIKKELFKNKFAISDLNGIKKLKTKLFEIKNGVNQATKKLIKEEIISNGSTSESDQNTLASFNTGLDEIQNILDASIPESVKKLLPAVQESQLKGKEINSVKVKEIKTINLIYFIL